MNSKKKIKAVVLFSGGLDSMLAARVLMAQEIEVVGVCFRSSFYGCAKARAAVRQLGIELKEINITAEMLALVKNPPSGYGKHLNPCLDCHALMIRQAAEWARKKFGQENFFIATGEVLGQRPFSQNRDALRRVEKLAEVEVLRPLSAKLLDETTMEKQGLVNRGRLLAIRGRGREAQMALARRLGIKDYPSPAGGCLLTDPEFSDRLGRMLDFWPECGSNDVELLKYGRVFWLKLKQDKNNSSEEKVLAVIGRHREDNENLERLAQEGDFMVQLKEIAGPTSLIRVKKDGHKIDNIRKIIELVVPTELKKSELGLEQTKTEKEIIKIISLLTAWYAFKARGEKVEIEVRKVENI